mgnify:CR=1 FL=1
MYYLDTVSMCSILHIITSGVSPQRIHRHSDNKDMMAGGQPSCGKILPHQEEQLICTHHIPHHIHYVHMYHIDYSSLLLLIIVIKRLFCNIAIYVTTLSSIRSFSSGNACSIIRTISYTVFLPSILFHTTVP